MATRLASLSLLGVLLFLGAGDIGTEASGPAPGRIYLQGTLIMGQQGKIVLGSAAPAGSGPFASVCWTIDDSPDTIDVTAMTDIPAGNPCAGGTAETIFAGGDYTIVTGVYVGGSQAPERQVTLDVHVDGDRFVTVDGAALSARPAGDANCDGVLDEQDMLTVVTDAAQVGQPAPCGEAGNVLCTNPLDVIDALYIGRFLAFGAIDLPDSCSPPRIPPVLTSPEDGAVFGNFPRDTTVEWQPVADAVSYVVEIDFYGVCSGQPEWCSDEGWGYQSATAVAPATTANFTFGGVGQGRWRVAAIDASGQPGPWSEWRTFEYTV